MTMRNRTRIDMCTDDKLRLWKLINVLEGAYSKRKNQRMSSSSRQLKTL